jgi:hypothetical protein
MGAVSCVGDLPIFKNNIISMVKPCAYNSVYYTVKSYIDDKEYNLNIDLTIPISWVKEKGIKECRTQKGKKVCQNAKDLGLF